ncbi:Nif3-like dinuclear metal center hexameric protein [Tepidibacter formicigenes]|jgi:dinuclear metal center YbgI/SA1388 family protein|uniref:GTP cyclohydrolase 1 type 2 homolog n=1 Tax=Tepidibacter formicigenes DSM 15518 TaxID=1123349 RepID=A0A1M6PG86_9FIRM|nr:Nif3-like dinuclear metal center hexameric protein [Tepidibacter formicigenes]SHK06953.1 dinuclear metal center protein, YbgI/SA1388 family [Tepidibacter formicigenes DSM 15518]
MYVKDIIKVFEKKYPKDLAYNWDNVGLMIGDLNSKVEKILVTLEATIEVVNEAVEKNVDLIITHHPFLFKGLKNINKNTPKGNCIYKLIQNNISVYSAHTNFDIAYNGLNDAIANILDLEDIKILDKTYVEKLYKIAIYTPISHEESVRDAMAKAGAGHIGKYSHCTFNTKGIGTFMPLDNSNPYIGSKDNLEKVEEIKIETICKQQDLNKVVNEMLKVHPYEEVAYDIYKLKNEGEKYGLGRIGLVKENMTLGVFAQTVKEKLNLKDLRFVGNPNKEIKKVAIVSGSGAEFISKAYNKGADVLITGDVKYHDAQDALEIGMGVIDAGHFGSENIFSDVVVEYLSDKLSSVNVTKSSIYIDPFVTI